MAVYTEKKTYHTKAHMGMIDVTEDFQHAVEEACRQGRVVPYWHHETWHDDNGSSHIKAALLSPFITVPFVNGKITVGPWQNLTLIECDTRDRVRDIVFQVMGE